MLLGDARAALTEFLISSDGAPYLADWLPSDAAPIHLKPYNNPQEPLVTVEADSRFQPLDRLPVTPMRPFVDDTGVIDIASRVIKAQQASIRKSLEAQASTDLAGSQPSTLCLR